MSFRSNIGNLDFFFAGEDKVLSYEVFAAGSMTTMENVSAFTLLWELRKEEVGVDPQIAQGASVLTKDTTGGGITVTGVYNLDRATNTQRVNVLIYDTDTEGFVGGRYVHSLKRMDAGLEAVLSHGTVELLTAATR